MTQWVKNLVVLYGCGLGHFCGMGSVPGPGTSACHSQKKRKKKKKKSKTQKVEWGLPGAGGGEWRSGYLIV